VLRIESNNMGKLSNRERAITISVTIASGFDEQGFDELGNNVGLGITSQEQISL
jgi:hypothetical protein